MKNILRLLPLGFLVMSLAFTAGDKKIVVIDVAHGGKDHGNTTESVLEKQIVLDIARKIVDLNDDPNLEIILTRNADEFMTLQDRVKLINSKNADLLVSLHLNAANSEDRSGIELFVSENNPLKERSAEWAENLKSSFSTDFEVAEVKNANFLILKGTNCPAALVEMGFMTNPSDLEFVQSEIGQEKMARTIYNSIRN